MNRPSDQQLLCDYTAGRSEAAFAELVRRYVDLVYSAALRMVRDAHLAEDVTQGTFLALARNGRQLTDRPVLSGWLHRTAQNLATKAIRADVRRRAREQEAAAMNELLARECDPGWEQIAPHLDAALGELNEADRDALLLRYFERKSAREMAQTLGISHEAAQKRVNRAVERVREFFTKRGVTVGASGLVVVLSTHAVQAAPAGLTGTVLAAATTSSGAALLTSTTLAMKVINAKAALALITLIVLGAGTVITWKVLTGLVSRPRTMATAPPLTTHEILYQEMLAAAPIAGEVVEGHPTRILWEDRKSALLQAGYIEAREIPLPKALSARGATGTFFDRFQARFRGVEMGLRALNGETPPIAMVTARKTDFGPSGAVEQFIRNYDPARP